MRITALEIDRFGIWSNLRIDHLSQPMTLLYGPNEAGKTTLMQFMRAMLYGFGHEGCRRFLDDRRAEVGVLTAGGRIGGSLWLSGRDGDYQVRRFVRQLESENTAGELRITSRDGTRQGAHRLNTLLGGIDDAIYYNVFAVGLRELQQLGALNDTEAARSLYNLSTGKDRVSLVDVMRQLRTTQAYLVGADGETSLLGAILERRNRCVAQLAELSTQTDRWARLGAERDRSNAEIERLEAVRAAATTRQRLLTAALRVRPQWDEWQHLDVELQALGNPQEIPLETIERVGELKQETDVRRQRLEQLAEQRRELRNRAGETPFGEGISRHTARAQALLEQRVAIAAVEQRRDRLAAQREETEFEIQAELERLGIATGESRPPGVAPRIDGQLLTQLYEPAPALEQEQERWEQAQQRAAQLREDAERIGNEISEALGHEPGWIDTQSDRDVVRAVENTGDLAARLRQRITLTREVAGLRRELQTLDDRHAQMLRSQLLPWEVVKALGGLFALGVALVLCGLFGGSLGWSDAARGTCVVLGGIAVAVAALVKVALDSTTSDELRVARQRTDRVRDRLKRTRHEIARIDASLPDHHHGKIKLDDAESILVRLEALLPLETRRRQLQRMAEQAAHRATEIASEVKFAQRRWEEALSRLGLNPQLSTAQFRQLAGESAGLTTLYYQHAQLEIELEAAECEMQVFRDRVRDGLLDMQIRTSQATPREQLDELQEALRKYQAQVKHRDGLLEQDRQSQREEHATTRQLRQLERQLQMLLSKAGASDEEDLWLRKQRYEMACDLSTRRQQLSSDIERAVRTDANVDDVFHLLRTTTQDQLEKQLELARGDEEKVQTRGSELLHRRGELTAQLEALESDRQLAMRQLELAELQHRLAEGARKWQIISAFSKLLTSVYKRYEKERQPETLQAASRYLARMTRSRYARIWTPLAEDVLVVDDAEGRSQRVEALSRGTREQVFLSLRLALIANYAARGVRMPVVLDDVLVNFDASRTAAAAEVLVEFAREGYQLLLFTCHQHIVQSFQTLGVEIRELPGPQASTLATAPLPVATLPRRRPQNRKTARRTAALELGFADRRRRQESPARPQRTATTAAPDSSSYADSVSPSRLVSAPPVTPPSRLQGTEPWAPDDFPKIEPDRDGPVPANAGGLDPEDDEATRETVTRSKGSRGSEGSGSEGSYVIVRPTEVDTADVNTVAESSIPPPLVPTHPTVKNTSVAGSAPPGRDGEESALEDGVKPAEAEVNASTMSGDDEGDGEEYEYVYEYVEDTTVDPDEAASEPKATTDIGDGRKQLDNVSDGSPDGKDVTAPEEDSDVEDDDEDDDEAEEEDEEEEEVEDEVEDDGDEAENEYEMEEEDEVEDEVLEDEVVGDDGEVEDDEDGLSHELDDGDDDGEWIEVEEWEEDAA